MNKVTKTRLIAVVKSPGFLELDLYSEHPIFVFLLVPRFSPHFRQIEVGRNIHTQIQVVGKSGCNDLNQVFIGKILEPFLIHEMIYQTEF